MFFRREIKREESPLGAAREGRYVVVHPLDDLPEEKVNPDRVGQIRMTRAVRISLISLRTYLVLMTLLLLYHVLGMGAWFAGHGR